MAAGHSQIESGLPFIESSENTTDKCIGSSEMGVYYDLGRPVIGGWMGGGWISHDPVRKTDLIWGGEFGQEGSVLFAVDTASGCVVERHMIGAREFSVLVQPDSGVIWIYNFHGLNQAGNILQSWDPETRSLRYHGFPAISGTRFVNAIWGREDRIYLGTHPFGHLVSFDPKDESWHDHGCLAPDPILPKQQIWCSVQFQATSGEIICLISRERPGQTVSFDPDSGHTHLLEKAPEPPTPAAQTKCEISVDIYGGTYTVDGDSRTFVYQPSVATDICGLNKGPDGKIYGSTIISMHIFSYDPAERNLMDLGRVGWGGGEVYDVIAHQDKLYMGSYTGAYWGVFDPSKRWNPRRDVDGEAEDANPRSFGVIGHDMNRPFEYAVGPDDSIYIACRANYGLPGGGLAVFDTATESLSVHRDYEQSVQCIAADDRYVYGGTSISGGRGCVETTDQGLLFIFDPDRQQRIFECVPDGDAVAVTSLAVSRKSGLVYGTTSTSHLFAFDQAQRQVIQTWSLRTDGTPLMGVPETYGVIHLTPGSDGDIYGCTGTDVFKLDVSTDRIHYLDQPPIPDLYQIVEGAPGIFYLGARGHLLEYHLKNTPHFR